MSHIRRVQTNWVGSLAFIILYFNHLYLYLYVYIYTHVYQSLFKNLIAIIISWVFQFTSKIGQEKQILWFPDTIFIDMEPADFSHAGIPAETRRKITAKLLSGRQSAARLQSLLQSAAAADHDPLALATKILTSFNESISILESAAAELSCPDHSLCSDLDSGDSRGSTAVKNHQGRANKRRCVLIKIWVEIIYLLFLIYIIYCGRCNG